MTRNVDSFITAFDDHTWLHSDTPVYEGIRLDMNDSGSSPFSCLHRSVEPMVTTIRTLSSDDHFFTPII